jgi:succinate dehydrogenase hydrophobic anchor subunit
VSVRAQVLLWTLQRLSAAVLAVCVVAHLVR